ncbi:hypothetical protein KQX54_015389 [Cotesia glomerata]|uniref:Uncharacterized protein n=1 Tax=Cotesia glomerata TaxID=32391 RepID=A0AAV7IM35_COTGL|nr:hypothetical protein KQX54_015389 [Cotesia glomerata]
MCGGMKIKASDRMKKTLDFQMGTMDWISWGQTVIEERFCTNTGKDFQYSTQEDPSESCARHLPERDLLMCTLQDIYVPDQEAEEMQRRFFHFPSVLQHTIVHICVNLSLLARAARNVMTLTGLLPLAARRKHKGDRGHHPYLDSTRHEAFCALSCVITQRVIAKLDGIIFVTFYQHLCKDSHNKFRNTWCLVPYGFSDSRWDLQRLNMRDLGDICNGNECTPGVPKLTYPDTGEEAPRRPPGQVSLSPPEESEQSRLISPGRCFQASRVVCKRTCFITPVSSDFVSGVSSIRVQLRPGELFQLFQLLQLF